MKNLMIAFAMCAFITCLSASAPERGPVQPEGINNMRLGNFSVSLSVKDLAASRAFYEKLGFKARGGDGKSWLVLQNDSATIGLFQGMFPKNTLTFNPGWDREAKAIADFDDVRDIQRELKKRGIEPTLAADESSTGPAHCVITDPDGNPILIDQHIAKPAK